MKKSKDRNLSSVAGKRKRAIARVRLKVGQGQVSVNGKTLAEYFGVAPKITKKINTPLELTGNLSKFDIEINVRGGGKAGQLDAVVSAISKSLAEQKATNRKPLKASGLLRRNDKIKESKKYGRKKARKRFQFSKR